MTIDLADVERELCRIPEVRAARIVADGSGNPVEVHVLAAPGKHAKQVVRDIQSVALATVGLSIDHRIVSVVQLDDPGAQRSAVDPQPTAPQAASRVIVLDDAPVTDRGSEQAPTRPQPSAQQAAQIGTHDRTVGDSSVIVLDDEPPAEPLTARVGDRRPSVSTREAPAAPAPAAVDVARIVVERVIILRRGLTCTAEVVLRLGDEIVTGDADGSSAASSTLRLAAEATLDALRQLHPAAAGASLESSFLTRSNDRTIALTALVLMVPPNEELMTGSAPVRGTGEHEAVARSVLDAMNRRLREGR